MAVESFSFLFVSCGQVLVVAIGLANIALIAGPIAVGADHAGGARHAIPLADLLALIVCVIFAHLRPVFYAVMSKYGLSRKFSDALAKIV
jgi:hypothetical protein